MKANYERLCELGEFQMDWADGSSEDDIEYMVNKYKNDWNVDLTVEDVIRANSQMQLKMRMLFLGMLDLVNI